MANTVNRNYPYPVPASDPDVPYWNQQLAESLDVDVKNQVGRIDSLELFRNNLRVGTVASLTTNANGDGQFTIPGGGFPNSLVAAVLTDATAATSLGALIVKWTSASSTKGTVTFRLYAGSNGAALPNITTASNLALGFMLVGS